MPKIHFADDGQPEFFRRLNAQGYSGKEIAGVVGVCTRTVRDWSRGKFHMSQIAFEELELLVNVRDLQVSLVNDYAHTSAAGKLGGVARASMPDQKTVLEHGRERLKVLRDDPEWRSRHEPWRKSIRIPGHSSRLAECTGIVLGDGGVSKYQVIVTSDTNERQYSYFVQELFQELFGVKPSICFSHNVNDVILSRGEAVRFFESQGHFVGDKVRHQVGVPGWIHDTDQYVAACIRGLMDTDGSFYVDKHVYKNTVYENPGLAFVNHSLPLLAFVKTGLERLGFHPTQKTEYSVFLRRENEVVRYFEMIGSSNDKHRNKFDRFIATKMAWRGV